MADRTHSHDTSTPAMSAETVPREEAAKLVYEAMVWARDQQPGVPVPKWIDGGNSDAQYEARRVIRKIADLSASHLAKEGGEAGAVERAAKALYEVRGVHRSTGREWEAAFPADRFYCIRDAEAALASLPQPSPALAKGGDAVREALEREGRESYEIGKRDGYEEAVQHIDQRTGGDGEYCCVVGHDADDRHCPDPQSMIARIVERFEALSTPTEGPISSRQTNAATHDVLDEAKINALPLPLIARFAGDKDWLPIHDIGIDAPLCRIDVSGKLEPRRFSEIMELKDGDGVIHDPDDFYLDADTPTEGPASQTEGMGEEAAADGSQAPLSDGRHRHLSRITEIVRGADSRMEAEQIALGYLRGAMSNEERAERAARDWAVAKWHEEVANRPLQNTHRRSLDTTWRQVIRYFGGDDERICGPRHDDLVATHDGMDFATPGTQVKPLEWQRFDNARTVTYRAMCPLGGIYYITSANEDPSFDGWKSHLGEFASLEAAKAAQQAEHEAKVRGCLARAALTPPETAEAVPVGDAAQEAEAYIQAAVDRAPEPLRRLGEWLANKLDEDDWKTAERMLLGAATASDPAPATDERERLVEALRKAEGLLITAQAYVPGYLGTWQRDWRLLRAALASVETVETAKAGGGETYYTKGKDADWFEGLSHQDAAWALTCAAMDLNDTGLGDHVDLFMPHNAMLSGAGDRIKNLCSALKAERARADTAEQRAADALVRAEKAEGALETAREDERDRLYGIALKSMEGRSMRAQHSHSAALWLRFEGAMDTYSRLAARSAATETATDGGEA